MRKSFYSRFISAVAISAVIFGGISCSEDARDGLGSTPPLAVAAVSVSAPEFSDATRVILNPTDLIKWYSSDKSYAGLYSPDKGIVKSTYNSTISADGFNAVFYFESSNITSFSSDAARIVYPCTAESKEASSFTFAIPAVQSLSAKAGSISRAGSSSCVPMISDAFAVKSTLTETTYPVGYKASASASSAMHLLSSIVAFYVYDSEGTYATEKVKSIEIQSSSVAIGAPKAVALTADNELPVLEGSSQSVKASFSSSSYYFALNGVTAKEQSAPIYVSIIPAEFAGKIVVTTDKGNHIFPFETPKRFNRAEVKDFYLNLSNPKAQYSPIAKLDITNVSRLPREDGYSGCKVVLTVKTDENCAGFCAYIGTNKLSTVNDVVRWGKICMFDDEVGEGFTSLGNGVYQYTSSVSASFYFAALPISKDGMYGIGKYLSYTGGYNSTKTNGDVADIEDDISEFNN